MTFLPIPVTDNLSVWCIDGRPHHGKTKGAQMLGGSLHPILLWCIQNNLELDENNLKTGLKTLKDKGFGIGVHRGHHAHAMENKSDCGFADKMPFIVQTAIENERVIRSALQKIYKNNKNVLGKIPLTKIVNQAFLNIKKYGFLKIKTTGEALIISAQAEGAQVVHMEGDHNESVAYVNLKEGTTLDTNSHNKKGEQRFNLDLWMVIRQTAVLGVKTDFALAASLILYMATEIVLVEMKGKPAVPVIINVS